MTKIGFNDRWPWLHLTLTIIRCVQISECYGALTATMTLGLPSIEPRYHVEPRWATLDWISSSNLFLFFENINLKAFGGIILKPWKLWPCSRNLWPRLWDLWPWDLSFWPSPLVSDDSGFESVACFWDFLYEQDSWIVPCRQHNSKLISKKSFAALYLRCWLHQRHSSWLKLWKWNN